MALLVKNLPANPWVGKIPGVGSGNPLQYSCLETPMYRGAWQATVHGVAKVKHMTKRLGTHTRTQKSLNSILIMDTFSYKLCLNRAA